LREEECEFEYDEKVDDYQYKSDEQFEPEAGSLSGEDQTLVICSWMM